MVILEEIEIVLLFVFIVVVVLSGILMFGFICLIGKLNRIGIWYGVKYLYNIVCNDWEGFEGV